MRPGFRAPWIQGILKKLKNHFLKTKRSIKRKPSRKKKTAHHARHPQFTFAIAHLESEASLPPAVTTTTDGDTHHCDRPPPSHLHTLHWQRRQRQRFRLSKRVIKRYHHFRNKFLLALLSTCRPRSCRNRMASSRRPGGQDNFDGVVCGRRSRSGSGRISRGGFRWEGFRGAELAIEIRNRGRFEGFRGTADTGDARGARKRKQKPSAPASRRAKADGGTRSFFFSFCFPLPPATHLFASVPFFSVSFSERWQNTTTTTTPPPSANVSNAAPAAEKGTRRASLAKLPAAGDARRRRPGVQGEVASAARREGARRLLLAFVPRRESVTGVRSIATREKRFALRSAAVGSPPAGKGPTAADRRANLFSRGAEAAPSS